MSKKKKRKIKLRAQSRSVPASAVDEPTETVADPRAAAARRAAVEKAARELFLAEGGGALEQAIRVGELSAECFETQLRAARDGGEDWGPTITPYEDRMNRGLQLRLIKERNKWLADCRKRVEADHAQAEESNEAEAKNPQECTLAGSKHTETEHSYTSSNGHEKPEKESEVQPAITAGSH